jgi:DnaJ family protein C protein 17
MSDAAAAKIKLLEKDLYKLFDLDEECTLEQIKKAYRKKALELHPDKNLDKKEEAEEKFVELGKAFEILTDKSAKAAYDAVRKQKREKAKRDELLDGKRRKLKEELESREQAAREKQEQQTAQMRKNKDEERLQSEIERLRKEGSRLLEEEMNYINEQLRLDKLKENKQQESAKTKKKQTAPPRIKVTWSKEATKLDHDLLNFLFSKYGEIEVLVVSQKSSAILEYKNYQDSIKCLNDERNLNDNYTIKLKCLDGSIVAKDDIKEETAKSEIPISAPEEEAHNFDLNNFEEMEMAILKKLKST